MDNQRDLNAYYASLLREHGNSPKSLAWPTREVQERNFLSVTRVFAHEQAPFTVYEVGCGLGDMAEHIETHYPLAEYAGCDVNPEMIAAAKARRPDLAIELRNILEEAPLQHDYVVTSGVFNLNFDGRSQAQWQQFIFDMLAAMYGSATKGIAANFHTSYVDWKKPDDYYQDPLVIFDFAKRHLSKFVDLRHAYFPWEYALHIYREPRPL